MVLIGARPVSNEPDANWRAQPSAGLAPPPAIAAPRAALFADLDGTLAPIAATPDGVRPDTERRRLLDDLSRALGGRLAVVSGRALADLDRLLEGRIPAVGAVHGLVRRTALGVTHAERPSPALGEGRRRLAAFADREGLIVEDKDWAVALHYRCAPERGAAARELAEGIGRDLGLEVQQGRRVVELRGPGPDKGEAVRAFMAEAPFAGHQPIFLGDDLTDEAGFRAAAQLGGYGVIVGRRRPTEARFALADVAAVHRWLAAAAEPRQA